MLTPYLICFPLSLVAANPILQRIPIQIPAQSWPTQHQTCPTQTCPNVSRPAPCQTCQNPYRNLFNGHPVVVQQPSNSCPCNKPAVQAVPNQPVNQEVISQLILKRLLSLQPQPQTAVLPVQNPAAVAKVCNQCEQHKVPNIINNYIILPPEYFKANETKVNNEDTVKRKGKRRRQQNRRRKQEADPACPCDEESVVNHHDQDVTREQVTSCPCERGDIVELIDHPKVQSDSKCISEPRTEEINDKILPERVTKIAQKIVHPQMFTENNPIDIEKPKRKNRGRSKSIEDAIIKDFCKKHPTIPEEIARSLLRKFKHQVESRHISHDDAYPYSPFGYNEFYPTMLYPQNKGRNRVQNDRIQSDRGSRRRKPYRSGRRNKKPKQEEIKEISDNCDGNCEQLVEPKPTVINIETETITTEKIIATTENKPKENVFTKESETQMETPDDLISQLEQMKQKFAKLNEIESTTVDHNKRIEYPELGKEDKVPTVYDNGVDDYYPDFRCDNIAFYASDDEQGINEDRYRYTTDKNGDRDCKRYVKKQPHINNFNKNENSCEYILPIPTESYLSNEESIKDESEEISFRIPPHLELPDFETKQLNRISEIKDKFVADDFRVKSYSDAKADLRMPEIEITPAKVFTKDKTGRTNIETVFGHSRVVKYGDTEGAGSDPVITYYLPEEAMTEDRIQLPDGEKAVVVAKSIRDLKDDWE